jgi:3-hydroxyisobutyrate dehydrogenase-like beta-hydroxyacid dehydrogenase
MTEQLLGFVGVGRMGIHMAGRLLEAGYQLAIYDINESAMARLEQRGAKRCASPAEVASAAEAVFVSLPTPDIVRSVALSESGIIAGSKVKVFVDLSTTGPTVAKEVAEGLARKGIAAVDAPVSGGPGGAERGTLAIMVSCPRALADRLRPAFDMIGKFFWIGEKPGMGQTMKLINNMLSATATSFRAASCHGASISASRPSCCTRTCGSAWKWAKASACRCWWGTRSSSCWRSARPARGRTPILPGSCAPSRNGRAPR